MYSITARYRRRKLNTMPRQVPFSEHEAAILLDAYLKTLSGEMGRMESVRECSTQLHQMAINAGTEIDDIYRNVNGISLQMASMESSYKGYTIMKPATRLFTEMVFLYRNNAARYQQLLKEAKSMANTKMNNEAVFMEWLTQNVSGPQLSELYLAFQEIEKQAKKVKAVKTSLYENLNPSSIKKIRTGVESSIIFKFTHKRQWGCITSAFNYLLQFVNQKAAETKTQETIPALITENVREQEIAPTGDEGSNALIGESILTKEAVPTEAIQKELVQTLMTENVREQEIAPTGDEGSNALLEKSVLTKEAVPTEPMQETGQSAVATTVNFQHIDSMAFSKPVSLSYFGEVKPEVTWKGLYIDACKFLLEDYFEVFTRLKEESLYGSGKTWIVDEGHLNLLAVPKKLEDEFYVETNRSASDLVKNLK